MKTPPNDPARILAVLAAGIGDFLLAAPALKELRRRFPRSRITLLVSEKVMDYARQSPSVDEVVALDGAGRAFPRLSRLGSLAALLRSLRDARFDVAISFYEISSFRGMVKMYALFKSIGAAFTVGRDTCGRGFFFDAKIPERYDFKKHQADYYADLLQALGANRPVPEASDLWLRPPAEMTVDSFLKREGLVGKRPLVGINPGSARASRFWPPERFAQVADALADEYGAAIVVTGGPGEDSLARAVSSRMRSPAAVCAGQFSIEGALALTKRLDLLVTTHSSLMHAACMLATPHVVLVGISDPVRDGPYRPAAGTSAVIVGKAENDPARKDEDEPSASMAAIEWGRVLAQAENLLGNRGFSPSGK